MDRRAVLLATCCWNTPHREWLGSSPFPAVARVWLRR